MAWSGATNATIAWAHPSALPVATDGGVDFNLQFSDQGPMLLRVDRPLLMQSSLSEGNP